MTFKFEIENKELEKSVSLQDAVDEYKKVRYGFKRYRWDNLDRGALLKQNKANGVYKDYLIAKGRRQDDGFYSRDEVDWNRYNTDMWNNYSDDFEKQVIHQDALKTLKEVAEAKNEILTYFIENYGHKVGLKVQSTKLGTHPIVSNEGISIKYTKGIFYIISPQKTLFITVKDGVMEMVNKTENPNIKFPPKAVKLFQEMLRLAELIALNPKEAIDDPHNYLDIDGEVGRKIRSAQKFLIKVNDEYMKKHNAQKKAQSKEQQLTHENYTKKTVEVTVSKAETIDEKKADAQAYPWKNFTIVEGNHYYGVRAIAYLDWLTPEEISAKCHKFMIDNDGLESVLDISHNEEITAIDSEYKNILIQKKTDTTILWIPEEEFQVFYNASK